MIKERKDIRALLQVDNAPHMGLVVAQHKHSLEGLAQAAEEGIVIPVLYGDEKLIRQYWSELETDIEVPEIVNCTTPEYCVIKAIEDVKKGKLQCLMKGGVETSIMMKYVVNSQNGIKKRNCLSLIAFHETPYYHKMIAITDVGITTHPTLEQKKNIIINAADMMHAIGVENPKIAILAAVESVNPKMNETVDALSLKEMNLQGEITGCIVEGPISYDLAMDAESAKLKNYESEVAGDADVLVVPDLACGNILAKALTVTGGAKTCGTVMGARVPIAISSRSASAAEKYYSIVLTATVGKNLKD